MILMILNCKTCAFNILWLNFLELTRRISNFSPSLGVQLLEFDLIIQGHGEVALVVQVKLVPGEICHRNTSTISRVMF